MTAATPIAVAPRPETDRRLVLRAFGDDTFDLVEQAPPEPGPGQVRCRVLAASVQFTDTLIRRGRYPLLPQKPPLTPGYDFVGEVDAVGEGVTAWKPGDRVADLTTIGGYARFVVRDAAGLTAVPEAVDPGEATTLVLSWMTAYQMMFRHAGVKSGDRVLIHGLGGAVGDAALQLAVPRGVEVFGTARPHHHERIEALGGRAVDYREDWVGALRELTGGEGFDAVFDPVGEAGFRKSRSLVARGGVLVPYGLAGYADKPAFRTILAYVKLVLLNLVPGTVDCRFYSIGAERKKHPDWWTEDMTALLGLLERGEIDPQVGERIGFDAVADAHRRLEEGGVQGKIVLLPT